MSPPCLASQRMKNHLEKKAPPPQWSQLSLTSFWVNRLAPCSHVNVQGKSNRPPSKHTEKLHSTDNWNKNLAGAESQDILRVNKANFQFNCHFLVPGASPHLPIYSTSQPSMTAPFMYTRLTLMYPIPQNRSSTPALTCLHAKMPRIILCGFWRMFVNI